jgi:hypothetical protein
MAVLHGSPAARPVLSPQQPRRGFGLFRVFTRRRPSIFEARAFREGARGFAWRSCLIEVRVARGDLGAVPGEKYERDQGARKRRTGPRFAILKRVFWDGRFLYCISLVFDLGVLALRVEEKKPKTNARARRETGDSLLRPACPSPRPLRPSLGIPFEQIKPDYLLLGCFRWIFASASTPTGCLLQLIHGLDEGARGAKSQSENCNKQSAVDFITRLFISAGFDRDTKGHVIAIECRLSMSLLHPGRPSMRPCILPHAS